MKRILSLILAVSMLLSVTAFGAITNVLNFYDQSTGTNYFFGTFEDGDDKVGIEIGGKEYVLSDEAYAHAVGHGNKFGIGIRDEKGLLDETYTATPYSYSGSDKHTYEDLAVTATNWSFDKNLLETLTVKGEEIPAFSPYRTWYHYVLDEGETLTADDISATPAMTYSNVSITETSNGFAVTTTSGDTSETVEIIPVEKGEYQAYASAELKATGHKNINAYYPKNSETGEYEETPVVKVNYSEGSQDIYDADSIRLKGPFGANVIQNGESNPYGAALVQFDISAIENINDRVVLKVPAYIRTTTTGTDYPGELGIIGVETELEILTEKYHDGAHTGCTYDSSEKTYTAHADTCTVKGTEAYNNALTDLEANNTQYMKNAVSMVTEIIDALDKEIAPRAAVTSTDVEYKEFDVTDYVRNKVAADEATVTFLVRAFHNAALSGSMDAEAQVTVYTTNSSNTALLTFTGYEGDVAVSDIKVNGTTIADFDKDTLNYSVIVDRDAVLPVVSAAVEDNENLSVEVTQATEIPGAATIKVTAYDGQSETYTVNFDYPFEQGTFTLSHTYRVQQSTTEIVSTETINMDDANGGLSVIQPRLTSNGTKVYSRYAGVLQFSTTAEGLNDNEEIILTISGRTKGNDENVVGSTLKIVGVDNEATYATATTIPTINREYTYTTEETLENTYKDFSYNVTDYVKNKLVNGCNTITFIVELVPSETLRTAMLAKNPTDAYAEILGQNAYTPVLEYRADTTLSSLRYNDIEIPLVAEQNNYIVTLEDENVPVVSATACENAKVNIVQATEVPGTAIITVSNGTVQEIYNVSFINASYVGSASLVNRYKAQRSTTYNDLLDYSNCTSSNSIPATRTIMANNVCQVRDEVVLRYDIKNILGLNEGQSVKLKLYGYGCSNAVGAYIDILTVCSESYSDGTTFKRYTVDYTYAQTSSNAITSTSSTTPDMFVFDVTEYVKERMKNNDYASFIIRVGTTPANAHYYYSTNAELVVE